jgi:dTDP-4-amino-4,6-dideoxygalactose transaminase
MRGILALASRTGLRVVEDAAQAILVERDGRPAAAAGQLGCLSFHGTKNVSCGEGGALVINDPSLIERAEIVHEKGTDRSQYLRGEVDKYSWRDIGSSFLPSEITAAILLSALESAEATNRRRMSAWRDYSKGLAPLEERGLLRRQQLPSGCSANGHMFFVTLRDEAARQSLRAHLAESGIVAATHYVPLHSSPAGRKLGRAAGNLPGTEELSSRLLRLPMWAGVDTGRVIAAIGRWADGNRSHSAGASGARLR